MEPADSTLFLSFGFWPQALTITPPDESVEEPEGADSGCDYAYPAKFSLTKDSGLRCLSHINPLDLFKKPGGSGRRKIQPTAAGIYNVPRSTRITFKHADETYMVLGTANGDVYVFDVTGDLPHPRNLLFCNDGSAVRCGCIYSHQVQDTGLVVETSGHVKCEPEIGSQKHAVAVTVTQEGHAVMWNISDGRALYSADHPLRDMGLEKSIKIGLLHFEHCKAAGPAADHLESSLEDANTPISSYENEDDLGSKDQLFKRSKEHLAGARKPSRRAFTPPESCHCARRVLISAGWSRQLQLLDARDLQLVATFDDCFDSHIADTASLSGFNVLVPHASHKAHLDTIQESANADVKSSVRWPNGMVFVTLARNGDMSLWWLAAPQSFDTEEIDVKIVLTDNVAAKAQESPEEIKRGHGAARDPIAGVRDTTRDRFPVQLGRQARQEGPCWLAATFISPEADKKACQTITLSTVTEERLGPVRDGHTGFKPSACRVLSDSDTRDGRPRINTQDHFSARKASKRTLYETMGTFRTSRYKQLSKRLVLRRLSSRNCAEDTDSISLLGERGSSKLEDIQEVETQVLFKRADPQCGGYLHAPPSVSLTFLKVEAFGDFLAVLAEETVVIYLIQPETPSIRLLGSIEVPRNTDIHSPDVWNDLTWKAPADNPERGPVLVASARGGTSYWFELIPRHDSIVPRLVKIQQPPVATGDTQTVVFAGKAYAIRVEDGIFRFYEWKEGSRSGIISLPFRTYDLRDIWPLNQEVPSDSMKHSDKLAGARQASETLSKPKGAVTYLAMVDEWRVVLGFSSGDIQMASMSWIWKGGQKAKGDARLRSSRFIRKTPRMPSAFGDDFVDEIYIPQAHIGAVTCLLATTLQRRDFKRFYLISSGVDWSLKIWNLESTKGYLLASFRVHNAPVYQIIHVEKQFEMVLSNCSFENHSHTDVSQTSGNSRSGSVSGTPRIGPHKTSTPPPPLESSATVASPTVKCIEPSEDASQTSDLRSDHQIQFCEFSGGPKRSLYFGRLKGCFVTLSTDNAIGVFSMEDLSFLRVLRHDEAVVPIRQLVWRPYEDHFLVESADSCVYVWTMRTGKLDRLIKNKLHADEVLNGRLEGVAERGDIRTVTDYAEWRSVVEWNPTANLAGSVRHRNRSMPSSHSHPHEDAPNPANAFQASHGEPGPRSFSHQGQLAPPGLHQVAGTPSGSTSGMSRSHSEQSISRQTAGHGSPTGRPDHQHLGVSPVGGHHSSHRYHRLLRTPSPLHGIGRKRFHRVNLSGAYSTLASASRRSPRLSTLSGGPMASPSASPSGSQSSSLHLPHLGQDTQENYYYYSRIHTMGIRDDNFRFGRRAIWGHLRDNMNRSEPSSCWYLTPIWLSNCHQPTPSAYMLTFDIRKLLHEASEWAKNTRKSRKAKISNEISNNGISRTRMSGYQAGRQANAPKPHGVAPHEQQEDSHRLPTSTPHVRHSFADISEVQPPRSSIEMLTEPPKLRDAPSVGSLCRSKMVPRDGLSREQTPASVYSTFGEVEGHAAKLGATNAHVSLGENLHVRLMVAKIILLSLIKWTGDVELYAAISERLDGSDLMQGESLSLSQFGFIVKGADGYLSLQTPAGHNEGMSIRTLWQTGPRIIASYLLTLNSLLRAFFAESDDDFLQVCQIRLEEYQFGGIEKIKKSGLANVGKLPAMVPAPPLLDYSRCSASLYYFAKYWQDSNLAVQQSCRAEVLHVIRRLDRTQRMVVQRYWHRMLPKEPHGVWWRRNWKQSLRATLILSAMCLESPVEVPKRMQRDIARALTIILSDKSANPAWVQYQNSAAYFMGKGFSIWEPYLDGQACLRLLSSIARVSQKSSAICMACRQAIVWIASSNSALFAATICSDLTHSPTVQERIETLKLTSLVVNKRPQVFLPYLPSLSDSVIKSLDPNIPYMREGVVHAITAFLHDFVKNYAGVSVHTGSQRLAVGSQEGPIVVFDLKTGTKFMILEGHKGPVTALSFSADGHYLVSFSKADQTVRTWTAPTGWLGMLAVAVGSAARSVAGHADDKEPAITHEPPETSGRPHATDTNGSATNSVHTGGLTKRLTMMRTHSSKGRPRSEVSPGQHTMDAMSKAIFSAASTAKPQKTYPVHVLSDLDISDGVNNFPQRIRFDWTSDRNVKLLFADADHTCFSFVVV